MNSLPAPALLLLNEFQTCQGWEQRARLLLKYGQQLQPLSAVDKNDTNLIQGCESPVWCLIRQKNGKPDILLDSDARLLKGLLAILQIRLQGLGTHELAQLDVQDWYNQLGLSRQLSPSRSNGLNAVLQHIRQKLPSA